MFLRKRRNPVGPWLFAAMTAGIVAFAAPMAQAALPQLDRVPADAVVAIGIADTASFWHKVDALPISVAIRQMMDSPQMKQNLDFQEFLLERDKLSEKLGYPVSFEEIFASVFKDAMIYAQSPKAAGQPRFTMLMTARDPAKVASLVKALDEKNSADASLVFEKTTLGGVQASHLRKAAAGTNTDGYYALHGDRLIVSTDAEAFTAAAADAAPAPGGLAARPELAQLTALVPWNEADLSGWIDGDALLKNFGGAGLGMIDPASLTTDNRAIFATRILPTSVLTQYASTADPARLSSNIQAGSLDGMKYIAIQPIVAAISRGYDVGMVYDQIQTLLNNPMVGMMFAGGQPGAAGSPMAQFEQSLGISIQDDLIPALGNEMFVAFNGLSLNPMNPMFSQANLVLGTRVRDKEKMNKVLMALERRIAGAVGLGTPAADPASGAAPAGPSFNPSTYKNVEIRSFALLPMFSPTYAIEGDYLLIGLSPQNVQQAIDRATDPAVGSLQTAPVYQAMRKLSGGQPAYQFQQIDFGKIIQSVVQPVLQMQMGGETGQSPIPAELLAILSHLDYLAMIDTPQAGNVLGFVNLQMK